MSRAGSGVRFKHDASVARLVARDGRCGFEVAPNTPPYFGVRGQGHAHIVPEAGMPIPKCLIPRYLGDAHSSLTQWLLGCDPGEEVAIRIDPIRIVTWGYSPCM